MQSRYIQRCNPSCLSPLLFLSSRVSTSFYSVSPTYRELTCRSIPRSTYRKRYSIKTRLTSITRCCCCSPSSFFSFFIFSSFIFFSLYYLRIPRRVDYLWSYRVHPRDSLDKATRQTIIVIVKEIYSARTTL